MSSLSRIILIFLIVCPWTVAAQEKQLPVDKVDEIQKLESLTNKMDQLQNLADSISKEKYYKCVKAFGNSQFCRCLSDNLPIRVSFENYITIVTSTRDELNYKGLNEDDKKMVDITYKVRELCVNKEPSKKTKK